MSRHFSNLFIFILTILSVAVGTYLWKEINLPYVNPQEIIGIYSKLGHSDLNDTVRYIVFTGLPLTTFFLLFVIIKKNECDSLKNIFLNSHINENNKNTLLKIFLYIFISVIIVKFFSLDFSNNKMDLFHEGQQLGGANIFNETNKLFLHSYFTTGLFFSTLNAKIAWLITGEQSLGSYRIFVLFLKSLTEIIYIIFCYNLCRVFNLEKNYEILFFLILSLFSIYLISSTPTINFRDIPLVLFLIFILKLIRDPSHNFIYSFFIGFLTIFTLLWSLDRGIYLIATLFPFIIWLFLKKRKTQIFFIFTGIILSWTVLYLIIGHEEFEAFVDNSITILRNSAFFHGIVYPTPFSSEINSTRGTKSLLIIILNGIIIISLLLSKKQNISRGTKLFLLFFFLLSCIFYKTGLTRADGGHIKGGLTFNLLLLAVFVCLFFFRILKKYQINKKLNFLNNNYLIVVLIPIIFIFFNFNTKNYSNIKNFSNRYHDFVKLDDNFFLTDDQIKLVDRLKELTNNENCFQVFTYESAIPYLIRKQSCSKFYQIFSLGSKKQQYDFIEEIKFTKPKYILFDGTYDSWGVIPKERFPYIYEYIKKNYTVGETFISWKILYLKK